jgi:signal transduction histidine kinase
MAAKRFKTLKQAAPAITFVLALAVGGLALWQAWSSISHLREEERETSRIYGAVIGALNDTVPSPHVEVLLELAANVFESVLQDIVTGPSGEVSACFNHPLYPDPCDALEVDDPRISAYLAELDRVNPPVETAGGLVHYGQSPVARRLTILTVSQLIVLLIAVVTGFWAYRAAVTLHRDRLWVAMARESAHQLGTPLMSAAAWIERLRDRDADTGKIAKYLRADLDRLERVAARFERIGRPARTEKVGMGSLAARVVNYFEPRLPRHANRVRLSINAPAAGPMVSGDPVLLEWAVEALVRNSIDALSGRGGAIDVSVQRKGERVEVRVRDDGPGVGIEVRDKLFEPGISTKSGGWGLGLALAHRIVEDVHGGELRLEPVDNGAMFVAQLPVA